MTGSRAALGKEVWRTWLWWHFHLILWHIELMKRVIRLTVFIWMAKRLLHCLRMWKPVSREQHEVARLAWSLSCALESMVNRSQASQGSLRVGNLPETRRATAVEDLPRAWALPWPGNKAQIKTGLSLHFFSPSNLLRYNLHTRNVAISSVQFHEVL